MFGFGIVHVEKTDDDDGGGGPRQRKHQPDLHLPEHDQDHALQDREAVQAARGGGAVCGLRNPGVAGWVVFNFMGGA